MTNVEFEGLGYTLESIPITRLSVSTIESWVISFFGFGVSKSANKTNLPAGSLRGISKLSNFTESSRKTLNQVPL